MNAKTVLACITAVSTLTACGSPCDGPIERKFPDVLDGETRFMETCGSTGETRTAELTYPLGASYGISPPDEAPDSVRVVLTYNAPEQGLLFWLNLDIPKGLPDGAHVFEGNNPPPIRITPAYPFLGRIVLKRTRDVPGVDVDVAASKEGLSTIELTLDLESHSDGGDTILCHSPSRTRLGPVTLRLERRHEEGCGLEPFFF